MMNCQKTLNGQTLEVQNPDKNNVGGHCLLFGLNGCSTVSESNARVSLEGKKGTDVVDLNVGVNVNETESKISGGVDAAFEDEFSGEKTVGLVDSGSISSEKVELEKIVKDAELKETLFGARKVEVCGGNISIYVDFSGSMGKAMNCSSSIVGFPADSSLPGKSFGESLIAQFESLEFLTQIKELSLCVSDVSIVELAKTKNYLAGFYRFIGHLQLPMEQIKEPSDDQNNASDLLIANRKRKIGESEPENHEIDFSDLQSPAMAESAELRERKKSKYLMFPFVDIEGKTLPNGTTDAEAQEVEPEKVIALPAVSCSSSKSKSTRFQKKWVRKFKSNNEVSSSPKFIDASVADLCLELSYMAEDCQHPSKCENFDIIEWFFSKFRIFAYHDESPASRSEGLPQKESQGNKSEKKKKKKQKKEKSDVKEKLKKQKQKSGKSEVKEMQKKDTPDIQNEQKDKEGSLAESKIISFDGVSIANMNIATDCGILVKENSGEIGPPTPNVIPAPKKRKRRPKEPKEGQNHQMTGIPDLNGNLSMDNSVLVRKQKTERKKKAVTADVNSSNSRLSTVSVELKPPAPIAADTGHELTKEGVPAVLKTPNPAEKEGLSVGSPTPNPAELGTTGEPPKKRRRRTKTTPAGENGETNDGDSRGTALLLSFTPGASLPKKEVLESTFCRFGQLREAETLLAKDVGLVQVVFVNNADAEEAVKSLESGNPFEATLVGHRLKVLPVVSVARKTVKAAPKAKVAVPVSQPKGPPIDVIRRNLEMMTKMLEKSGDSLSPEMRAKLECEIEGLKKKVNSLPGSSSS